MPFCLIYLFHSCGSCLLIHKMFQKSTVLLQQSKKLKFMFINLKSLLMMKSVAKTGCSYHFPCKYSLVVMVLQLLVHSVHIQLFQTVLREALKAEQVQQVDIETVTTVTLFTINNTFLFVDFSYTLQQDSLLTRCKHCLQDIISHGNSKLNLFLLLYLGVSIPKFQDLGPFYRPDNPGIGKVNPRIGFWD